MQVLEWAHVTSEGSANMYAGRALHRVCCRQLVLWGKRVCSKRKAHFQVQDTLHLAGAQLQLLAV